MEYPKEKELLTGHETFSLREGWIYKYSQVNKGVQDLATQIDLLGVGSNMVKSIDFWGDVFNLKHDNQLNPIFEMMIKKDPYIQKKESIWILHYLAIKNNDINERDKFPLVWITLFYDHFMKFFTKDELIDRVKTNAKKTYSFKSIESSVNVFLRTYLSNHEDQEKDPETYLTSPLGRLNLITKEGDVYRFRPLNFLEINIYVAFLVFRIFSHENQISIYECYDKFHCCMYLMFSEFELLLKKMKSYNLIEIEHTGGHDNIILKNTETDLDIINLIYSGLFK